MEVEAEKRVSGKGKRLWDSHSEEVDLLVQISELKKKLVLVKQRIKKKGGKGKK